MEKIEHLYGWTWVGDYNPFSVGWQECDPGHNWGPGFREFRVIHYVLSGKGLLRIRNKEYHLRAGDLFSLPPLESAYYEADAEDPWSYVWISFINNEGATYLFDNLIAYVPQLRPVFMELKDYEDLKNTGKIYTAQCLNYIAAQLMEEKSDEAALFDNAVQYIQQHYSSSTMSVAELADIMKVHRNRLSAVFMKEKGVTPVQYIIQYRLDKACKFMKEKKITPVVASRSVGYVNYSQFYKIFLKYKGITPNEYYKQQNAEDFSEDNTVDSPEENM